MKNENNLNGMAVYAVLAMVIAVMWIVIFNNIALGIIFTAISVVVSFFALLPKNKKANIIDKYEK